MLDRNGTNEITVADIINVFDVSKDPEFIERRQTKEQILTAFLNNFDGAKGNNDGVVTYDEFVDYYSDISMPSVRVGDDYFVAMMESTWQCTEDETDPESQKTVTMLLKEVRERILELSKNDPKLLEKLHQDFDRNHDGSLTIDEVTAMIAKLKISVERKYVYPFFKILDADNSGGIEYSEFESYIFGK